LEGYDFTSAHRENKKGGGVGIYIAERLKYKLRKDLNINIYETIESTFIEVATENGKNIIVGVIYRPPNNKIETFENAMNQILSKLGKENKICYLMGDFNIDLLKSESCDFANNFTEQLFTSSFYPLITKPTRITSHTVTLIYNIFTNNIDKIDSSINGIIFSDISDHLQIVHTCCLDTLKPSKNTEEKYYTKIIYNRNSLNLFSDEIEHLSWEGMISSNNPCESFNQFSMLFTSSY
jgi:exonuclease III